ncbi:glycosyltransferase family 2 protein [Agrobacterium pusense]|uniref:glycosyltransferase family 2 protein n=1 Tax=Agrobacterium pusense TaxID=648995 RepID=UPI0010AEAAE2|nr:glycosyltransferase [Agrobacterium pusense]WCK26368.1 hypothetical protein CFBP5496_0019285 [Agrobacterium pusense]
MFTLQNITLPSLAIRSNENMYFRAHRDGSFYSYQTESLSFQKSAHVSLDCFFNAFSIGKWKKNCALTALSLRLRGKGRFVLRFGLHRLGFPHQWLQENTIDLGDDDVCIPVEDWHNLEDGLLYISLYALDAECMFKGGEFVTPDAASTSVKLGIVITHFNRKQWVVPAIRRIADGLLSDPRYSEKISLVVVDNSSNLTEDEARGAILLPNKNLGGSGGFTRGLLYLEDDGSYTHCLFMDDDASCEIESIRRAYAVLCFAKDPKLAIAGSLLRELEPSITHEIGGQFNKGNWRPIKSGLDLSYVHHLSIAEKDDEIIEYGAWWFFAFKIDQIESYPFPFFVRGDDALFGKTNSFKIMTMNGITCWGEDFWYKESPLTRYLGFRSTLAVMLITGDSGKKRLFKLIKGWLKGALLTGHYESVLAMAMAIDDVAKGPAFFVQNIDCSEQRKRIAEIVKNEKLTPVNRPENLKLPRHQHEKPIKKALRLLTLNGLLLPSFLMNNKIIYQPKGFSGNIKQTFGYKKIYYEYEPLSVGFIAEFNRIKILKTGFVFMKSALSLLLKIDDVAKRYKTEAPKIMTKLFWEDVYRDK